MTLRWHHGEQERLIVTSPSHPIAQGIPERFDLAKEEMYGEYFDIPKPDEVIFAGWFSGGQVFRSGCTFTRGLGKIFYFQPGHEDEFAKESNQIPVESNHLFYKSWLNLFVLHRLNFPENILQIMQKSYFPWRL